MRFRTEISRYATTQARSLHVLALGLSAVGYVLCVLVLVEHGIGLSGGGGGADTLGYWTAGSNLLAGRPIYGAGAGGYAAYLYPPPLAQLFAPLSLLPFPTAVWLWRIPLLGCLRVAVGSWVKVGLVMLVWPPVIAELDAGNVHLVIAAAVALAIRGRPEGVLIGAAAKYASVAAIPMSLARHPDRLLVGVVIALCVFAASFLITPQPWLDFATFLLSIPSAKTNWYDLGRGTPVWVRFGPALMLALLAIRWPRLAAVAAVFALPVLWLSGLSILVAALASPDQTEVSAARRLEGWSRIRARFQPSLATQHRAERGE